MLIGRRKVPKIFMFSFLFSLLWVHSGSLRRQNHRLCKIQHYLHQMHLLVLKLCHIIAARWHFFNQAYDLFPLKKYFSSLCYNSRDNFWYSRYSRFLILDANFLIQKDSNVLRQNSKTTNQEITVILLSIGSQIFPL